mgnify:CR=1 FL=1
MKKNKKLYPNLIAITVLCCVFSVAYAQPPLPGVDDGMIVVPVSGGITLLLAASWYGMKRINKNRK